MKRGLIMLGLAVGLLLSINNVGLAQTEKGKGRQPVATVTTTLTASVTLTATESATASSTATASAKPGITESVIDKPSSTATRTITSTSTQTPSPTSTTSPTPLPTTTPCPFSFTDVPASNVFHDDINFVACHGVARGYPNSNGTLSFRPNNSVTRGQLAKFVVLGLAIPPAGSTHVLYSDVPASDVFFNYVSYGSEAHILHGYSDGLYHPANNVTRAELALVIAQARSYVLTTPTTATFVDVPPSNFAYAAIETLASRGILSGQSCGANRCFYPSHPLSRGELAKIIHRTALEDTNLPPPARNFHGIELCNNEGCYPGGIFWDRDPSGKEGYYMTTYAFYYDSDGEPHEDLMGYGYLSPNEGSLAASADCNVATPGCTPGKLLPLRASTSMPSSQQPDTPTCGTVYHIFSYNAMGRSETEVAGTYTMPCVRANQPGVSATGKLS